MELMHKRAYDALLQLIQENISLNDAEITSVMNAFEFVQIPKQTRLESENRTTKYLYFINSGFVRVFYLKDGEDRTTQINCPSRFITSFQSYITQTAAYDNVETITDCELLRISKDRLDQLNLNIEKWGIFGEKIYELALVYNEERTRDMILLNAEERYRKLIETQTEIVKHVPLQFIASYIGIKPESLSRIRRQMIS